MEWFSFGAGVYYSSPENFPLSAFCERGTVSTCIVDNSCLFPQLEKVKPILTNSHKAYRGVVIDSEGNSFVTEVVSSLKRAKEKTEKLYFSVLELT